MCEAALHVLQRGASNLYFGETRSALDIPPESAYSAWSDVTLAITSDTHFDVLLSDPEGPIAGYLMTQLAQRHGCTEQQVRAIVAEEVAIRAGEAGRAMSTEHLDLETGEWKAFLHREAEQDDRDRFVTDHVSLLSGDQLTTPPMIGLARDVGQVVIVRKLREVRALIGFSRYRGKVVVKPDLGRGLDWLPAVEVFGEGIFMSLPEERVRLWEEQPEVVRRIAVVEERRGKSFAGERKPRATPRLVLVHTLAHVLIRRLSFECGYATASLRERLYVRHPDDGEAMAGLLIYTAAGDVEGTLGGLARQGESPRLARTLLGTLEVASWCSLDPLCRESTGQGFAAMSLAACHACALLPETSCVLGNALLDRVMLVGGSGDVDGYFTEVRDAALVASARREVTA